MLSRFAFSADGRTLATCGEPKVQITLWHVALGASVFRGVQTASGG